MRMTMNLTALTFAALSAGALASSASPLAAQIVVRDDPGTRRPTSGGGIGDIIFGDGRVDTSTSRRARNRVPPGHLPPRGMCRVWIDGVPPGQQPPVTDCATAERNRVANSRVIYGDRETFRGRANGKFDKNRRHERQCQIRDGVVVDGQVVNVCSDDERARQERRRSRADDDDDDRDDDDRFEKRGKDLKKAEKAARKESRKSGRG